MVHGESEVMFRALVFFDLKRKEMKYPKKVTVIELENAPFRCAKDAVMSMGFC